jgi:hypothetical protein
MERGDLRAADARRIVFDRLVDDAGLFPPARKPMERAVADHRAARAGAHAWMLGRFLCPVSRLTELAQAEPDAGWRLGAIADGENWRDDLGRVAAYDGPGTVDAIELRLPGVLDEAPHGVDLFVEVPTRDAQALTAALGGLAADGRAGAKIRCGGVRSDAFPSDEAVARFIGECVRLGLPFKATAGLHHPFRTRDEQLRVLQHGFVNLLAATALVGVADGGAIIGETDPPAFELSATGLRWRDHVADADALARARRMFTACGSCSFEEPVADLVAHGILQESPARA